MRIDRIGGRAAVAGHRRAGGAFRLPDTLGETEPGTIGVQAADAASVLALQQAPGLATPTLPPERRLAAALDDLAVLQRALLGEDMDPSVLEKMAKQAEDMPAGDPGLRDVAAAIGLRVRVELARREIRGPASTTKE